jgi:hypothetical protein
MEVVRVLETHPLAGAAALDVVVTLPWTPPPGDAAVVALVEAGPRGILGADSAELP